jgi:hypothetical protein
VVPSPPSTWQRLLRLPQQLVREIRLSAGWRWRSPRRRLRERPFSHAPLRRAWLRTDPAWFERISAQSQAWTTAPADPPPAAGTTVTINGRLSADQSMWGGLRLDQLDLDDAVAAALDLGHRVDSFPVQITVRVIDEADADAVPGRCRRAWN